MGWANCGTDSKGRQIGYAVSAKCDEPGCKERIDRGLGYACGGWHGDTVGCEKYFCGEHRSGRYSPDDEGWRDFCSVCAASLDELKCDEADELAKDIVAEPGSAAKTELAKDFLERWGEAERAA